MRLIPATWTFFSWGFFLAILGAGLLSYLTDFDLPDEADLVMLSGDVDTAVVADELATPDNKFDTPLPLDVIYIRLKQHPGEFRYRSTWPNFSQVRDVGMASSVDLWVDRRRQGSNEPLDIYQMVERNPLREPGELHHVSFESLVSARSAAVESWRRVGGWLLGIGLASTALGLVMRRVRRNTPG